MSTFQRIQADLLKARRDRDQLAVTALSTLISEVSAVAKKELREVTEADVQSKLTAFVDNLSATLKLVDKNSARASELATERALLESYRPKQLAEAELQPIIAKLVDNAVAAAGGQKSMRLMGSVVRELQAGYAYRYDPGQASRTIKSLLA